VSIAPADFGSWHDARTELMSEAKSGLKARVEAELAAAADEDELKTLEHQIGLLPKHPLNPHNPLRGHAHPRFFTQITRSTPSRRR